MFENDGNNVFGLKLILKKQVITKYPWNSNSCYEVVDNM